MRDWCRQVCTSLCVGDLKPTAVAKVRAGTYRQLSDLEQLISGEKNATNNFARGRYTIGKKVVDCVFGHIRKLANNYTGVQGFLTLNAGDVLFSPCSYVLYIGNLHYSNIV